MLLAAVRNMQNGLQLNPDNSEALTVGTSNQLTSMSSVAGVSAGLTHKRTKRALRAPSWKGAPSKTGRKISNYTFQRVQI